MAAGISRTVISAPPGRNNPRVSPDPSPSVLFPPLCADVRLHAPSPSRKFRRAGCNPSRPCCCCAACPTLWKPCRADVYHPVSLSSIFAIPRVTDPAGNRGCSAACPPLARRASDFICLVFAPAMHRKFQARRITFPSAVGVHGNSPPAPDTFPLSSTFNRADRWSD